MKEKVLIIDDERKVALFLKETLLRKNFFPIVALDGVDGLKKALIEKPDLILLDLQMPGKDGFNVLKELKAQESTKDIPVIIISANSQAKSIFEGSKCGAADYIIKPVDLDGLFKSIQRSLVKPYTQSQDNYS